MTLFGVSVGAGDPGNMTLNALAAIDRCRVIAVPETGGRSAALGIAEGAADLSGKEIIRLALPMTRDPAALSEAHRAAAERLCRVLEKEDAAMVCLGDVSLYSTFSYIAALVRERGHAVRYIPGVCSPCAAADAVGVPLASGSEPLMILPYGAENFAELMDIPCRKVIIKCGSHGAELKRMLRENGTLDRAYAVENCGMAGEKIFRGEDIPDETGYFTVCIL